MPCSAGTGATGATGSTGPNSVTTATTTGLTGLLKGNGSNVTTATAGTDYVAPAGNVATATALAANGTNCAVGQYAGGVDASGIAENCTADANSGGTVTSVAMTVPSILSVSGTPITGSGTLAVSLATQSANRVLAGPATGSAAVPTFRALQAADIPGAPTLVRKTGNQLVTNSTTLVNDTDLVFAMAASTAYEFDAWVVCIGGGNNATDCKFTFTVPSGAMGAGATIR